MSPVRDLEPVAGAEEHRLGRRFENRRNAEPASAGQPAGVPVPRTRSSSSIRAGTPIDGLPSVPTRRGPARGGRPGPGGGARPRGGDDDRGLRPAGHRRRSRLQRRVRGRPGERRPGPPARPRAGRGLDGHRRVRTQLRGLLQHLRGRAGHLQRRPGPRVRLAVLGGWSARSRARQHRHCGPEWRPRFLPVQPRARTRASVRLCDLGRQRSRDSRSSTTSPF